MPERAAVQILLDPGDDVRVSVGLLQLHDPAGGLVVVHPTPGMSRPAATAHDVLAALGRSVGRLAAEHLAGREPAWRAVTARLLTDQITDLVVLRADRLSAPGWAWLLRVCRATDTRLLLVCHVPAVPPVLAAALEGIQHHIVTDLRQAPGGASQPQTRETPHRPAAGAAGAGGRGSAGLRQRVRPVLPQPGAGSDRHARLPADRRGFPARSGRGPDLAEHPPPRGNDGPRPHESAAVPDHARARQPHPQSHPGPPARGPGRIPAAQPRPQVACVVAPVHRRTDRPRSGQQHR